MARPRLGSSNDWETATIAANYSILVRPPSPHTVLMDILIGFGHIIWRSNFKKYICPRKPFEEHETPLMGNKTAANDHLFPGWMSLCQEKAEKWSDPRFLAALGPKLGLAGPIHAFKSRRNPRWLIVPIPICASPFPKLIFIYSRQQKMY